MSTSAAAKFDRKLENDANNKQAYTVSVNIR
jgi:hypothetical protein